MEVDMESSEALIDPSDVPLNSLDVQTRSSRAPMPRPALPPEPQVERIRMVGDPAIPGVELWMVDDSVREWKVFNTVHSINTSESWVGRVDYRGHTLDVTPGQVFCTEPGEAHSTSRPIAPGSLRLVMFEELALRAQLEELDFDAPGIHFTESVTHKAGPQLRRLIGLMAAPGRTPLELQTAFVDLAAAVGQQLVANGPRRPLAKDDGARAADLMRDLLHAQVEEGESPSLDALASAANLGRFRALRAFKLRHGIPPHTYELCLRLGRARELIKGGQSPATAAMECGFADQSHMTRHFRSYLGFTPAKYAKHLVFARARKSK